MALEGTISRLGHRTGCKRSRLPNHFPLPKLFSRPTYMVNQLAKHPLIAVSLAVMMDLNITVRFRQVRVVEDVAASLCVYMFPTLVLLQKADHLKFV